MSPVAVVDLDYIDARTFVMQVERKHELTRCDAYHRDARISHGAPLCGAPRPLGTHRPRSEHDDSSRHHDYLCAGNDIRVSFACTTHFRGYSYATLIHRCESWRSHAYLAEASLLGCLFHFSGGLRTQRVNLAGGWEISR